MRTMVGASCHGCLVVLSYPQLNWSIGSNFQTHRIRSCCVCVCVCAVGDVSQERPHMFTFTFHILSQEGEVFEAWSGLQSMLQPCPCLRKQGLKDRKNDHAYSHQNNSILKAQSGLQSMLQPCPCLREPHTCSHPNNPHSRRV